MGFSRLTMDPVRLLRLAELTAKDLSAQHEELLTDEALLRAAIAWAQFARNAHLALIERLKDCPKDGRFLEVARRRRIRTENYLRLRLTATIPRKCELMNHERVLKVAELALARRLPGISRFLNARRGYKCP
jgi:hypothetical protein